MSIYPSVASHRVRKQTYGHQKGKCGWKTKFKSGTGNNTLLCFK